MGSLRLGPEGEDVFAVIDDDERIGRLELVRAPRRTTAVCELDRHPSIEQAREFVRDVDRLPADELFLETRNELIRFAAREAGYDGPLRAPLRRGGVILPVELADALEVLLPRSTARVVTPRGRFRRWAADATAARAGMIALEVVSAGTGPITVLVPGGPLVIAETIALAVDTTVRIHERFGGAVDYVRTLSFDHAGPGFAKGRTAGAAAHILGLIHLNASFALAAEIQALSRKRSRRTSAPATVPPPWSTIDGVVAHELWHKLELAWEARAYRETIEFRREIGRWFGSETLEKVMDDDRPRATLVREVSPYAATNAREATAEMFEVWWCGPPPAGSVPARFGELVNSLFP